MQKVFFYIFFSHTEFFFKLLIFHVIYTNFVLNQSGKSAIIRLDPRLIIIECPSPPSSPFFCCRSCFMKPLYHPLSYLFSSKDISPDNNENQYQ